MQCVIKLVVGSARELPRGLVRLDIVAVSSLEEEYQLYVCLSPRENYPGDWFGWMLLQCHLLRKNANDMSVCLLNIYILSEGWIYFEFWIYVRGSYLKLSECQPHV